MSWWFVRVAAVSITGHLGADHLPSIAVTDNTGVFVITELGAIRIFFAMKHAACDYQRGDSDIF